MLTYKAYACARSDFLQVSVRDDTMDDTSDPCHSTQHSCVKVLVADWLL